MQPGSGDLTPAGPKTEDPEAALAVARRAWHPPVCVPSIYEYDKWTPRYGPFAAEDLRESSRRAWRRASSHEPGSGGLTPAGPEDGRPRGGSRGRSASVAPAVCVPSIYEYGKWTPGYGPPRPKIFRDLLAGHGPDAPIGPIGRSGRARRCRLCCSKAIFGGAGWPSSCVVRPRKARVRSRRYGGPCGYAAPASNRAFTAISAAISIPFPHMVRARRRRCSAGSQGPGFRAGPPPLAHMQRAIRLRDVPATLPRIHTCDDGAMHTETSTCSRTRNHAGTGTKWFPKPCVAGSIPAGGTTQAPCTVG